MDSDRDWRPTATLAALEERARILRAIRRFFHRRGVLEVETPLLSEATVPDLHLDSFRCRHAGSPETLYLQTSPEYAMKRLLAAGAGPIFQITKAFRDGEAGRRHNPEFTLLEWYRPGFDHHALMDEMDELLAEILAVPAADRLTYQGAFAAHVHIDPHRASPDELRQRALDLGLSDVPGLDRDGWLHLLFSHVVEPELGIGRPTFVFDFPASQAALSIVRPGDPPVAERFEVFVGGVELANGFHELTDAEEQRQRFEDDRARRAADGRHVPPLDTRFLDALETGLPPSAGVALGLDRLVMLALGATDIADVLAFPVDRA